MVGVSACSNQSKSLPPKTNLLTSFPISRKNGNKPVIKFQYDGHGLESKYNNLGKSYSGQDWLSDTKYENFGKYKWGNADSYPDQFRPGGTRDLCWYV